MVGRHHRLNGHEFEQALGVGDGQGSLVCCSPWGRKELTELTECIFLVKILLPKCHRILKLYSFKISK